MQLFVRGPCPQLPVFFFGQGDNDSATSIHVVVVKVCVSTKVRNCSDAGERSALFNGLTYPAGRCHGLKGHLVGMGVWCQILVKW